MDEYYCPNCGATLNNQSGFDPDNGTWTCTQCGQHLMDDDTFEGDSYEGVAWYCDECGTLLNKQSGFSDDYGTWTCTECGHTNGTTEDDIYESEEDYQYQKTVNATADFISSVVTGIISGIADGSSEDTKNHNGIVFASIVFCLLTHVLAFASIAFVYTKHLVRVSPNTPH